MSVSPNALSVARQRLRALNHSVAAGSPVVRVAPVTSKFTRPKIRRKYYGGAKALWESTDPQVMLAGPAETGKTTAVLDLMDWLCWEHPGLQATLVRKAYTDMPSTVLQSYEKKVLLMGEKTNTSPHGVLRHGGEYPQSYSYPNGAKVWVAGLDKNSKVLSAERDLIVVNQAEELEAQDWEVLSSRTTGRAGVLRPGRLIGDCNPGPSTHWIMAKAKEGHLRFLESRHEDNPTLFDPVTGNITEQGAISMAALDTLTGVRLQRYRYGRWVAAEGTVYEFLPHHFIDEPVSDFRFYVGAMDWGLREAGVLHVWGVDNDRRMTLVLEVYQTERLVAASTPGDAWWINKAVQVHAKYNLEILVCDPSEPAYIEAMELAGLPAYGAFNSIPPGIQKVESRLPIQADGRPRLMVMRDSLESKDLALVKARKPTCLKDEAELYSWPKDASGKPLKEVPLDANNHAMDTMRYAVAYVDGLGPELNNFYFF